jgi:hypothetical protein
MLSVGGVPIPGNPVVPLSKIFWNGGPPINTETGLQNIPAPYQADATKDGAIKTITITNNGPVTVYPFLSGENIGKAPLSTTGAFYDPQDITGHGFREYVGWSEDGGKRKFLGLPTKTSITIQVPLVLWDGDDLFFATDGAHLTDFPIFFYSKSAQVTIVGSETVSGTTWVRGSSNFPVGETPLVMFYFDPGPPLGVPTAAPAQLTETTFRDQYLTHFINDSSQTFPLLSYDVSYVNNLVAPVSMEASDVPITFGNTLAPTPPTYYGIQNWGWAATDRDVQSFGTNVNNFIKNLSKSTAWIGSYFNGKGWPQYYNPVATDLDIPSGGNIFLDSPFNVKDPAPVVHTSPYDSNFWLLTSAGDAPITAGGAGYGQQGFVHDDATDRIYFNSTAKSFVPDLAKMLKQGVVNVTFPGQPTVLSTVNSYVPNNGTPYIQLNSNIAPTGVSGKVFTFSRTASDYAANAITNLWYGWAEYYYLQNKDFAGASATGTVKYFKPPDGPVTTQPTNVITLTTTPQLPLAVGMTVTAGNGIAAGTTILKIVGNDIYLSTIPNALTTPESQSYMFGAPTRIPFDAKYTTPVNLTFDAGATAKAVQFAGSVYETMAAEFGLNPSPYLPDAMALVGNVIQFYAKLPGFDIPGSGPLLVADVRDIVKSVLRGVYDFHAVPDQSQWYPPPADMTPGLTSGQTFNVYNLDPYVWFVHTVQDMSAYGFSIDDDVSNPISSGPLKAKDGGDNHLPNNLQIGFGGTGGLTNTQQWFPTIPWGQLTARVTISDFVYQGNNTSLITFIGPDAAKFYNMINNPGTGQIGAFINAVGYIKPGKPGTTLIFKGPNGADKSQIVLSDRARPSQTAINVTITGKLPSDTVKP